MIIIDSDNNTTKGQTPAVLTLFADSKAEVPSTGASTAALIPGFKGKILPTSIIYTANFEVAVLKTNDNWSWKV